MRSVDWNSSILCFYVRNVSLFVWGAWIEIVPANKGHTAPRRSSYEERGLKSLPQSSLSLSYVALRMRSVDWNPLSFLLVAHSRSLFVWGAWIEILCIQALCQYLCRSSYEERGLKYMGVGFNCHFQVALRMRSVDWNACSAVSFIFTSSLFVWGAWIEILYLSLVSSPLRRSSYEERGLK